MRKAHAFLLAGILGALQFQLLYGGESERPVVSIFYSVNNFGYVSPCG